MLSRVSHTATRPATPTQPIVSYLGDTKTIMVVDDDAPHRGLISEILTPLGFVVLEAQDANACLEAINNADVDLFLLDISMPGMNGWDLAQALRDKGIRCPIIMASADAIEGPDHWVPGGEKISPNNDYLIKPIRDNTLLEKLGAALDLSWCYEPGVQPALAGNIDNDVVITPELFQGVSDGDCRELIAMAEMGFVDGLEKVLIRLESQQDTGVYVATMRRFLGRYQFAEIIAVNKRALR